MTPTDPTSTEPTDPPRSSVDLRKVLAGVLAIGVVAAVLVLVVWWRRGGAREAVKELAEQGAVALADVIVDEIFPAA
jgi:hypothetical protein